MTPDKRSNQSGTVRGCMYVGVGIVSLLVLLVMCVLVAYAVVTM